jgi:hypothetical protein
MQDGKKARLMFPNAKSAKAAQKLAKEQFDDYSFWAGVHPALHGWLLRRHRRMLHDERGRVRPASQCVARAIHMQWLGPFICGPFICTIHMHHSYALICTIHMHHSYAPFICITIHMHMHHHSSPFICTIHHHSSPFVTTQRSNGVEGGARSGARDVRFKADVSFEGITACLQSGKGPVKWHHDVCPFAVRPASRSLPLETVKIL